MINLTLNGIHQKPSGDTIELMDIKRAKDLGLSLRFL